MKYLLLLSLVVFVGCNEKTDDNNNIIKFGLNVAVVNGCQYVIYVDNGRSAVAMVHAGNCNNPIHGNVVGENQVPLVIDTISGQILKKLYNQIK